MGKQYIAEIDIATGRTKRTFPLPSPVEPIQIDRSQMRVVKFQFDGIETETLTNLFNEFIPRISKQKEKNKETWVEPKPDLFLEYLAEACNLSFVNLDNDNRHRRLNQHMGAIKKFQGVLKDLIKLASDFSEQSKEMLKLISEIQAQLNELEISLESTEIYQKTPKVHKKKEQSFILVRQIAESFKNLNIPVTKNNKGLFFAVSDICLKACNLHTSDPSHIIDESVG